MKSQGSTYPALIGDSEVLPAAELSRARIAARLDHLDCISSRRDLHEGTRRYLRKRITKWRENLATVTIAAIWDGADNLAIAEAWQTVDTILNRGVADYEAIEEWLATKSIPYPLKVLEEWRGYSPTEYMAWAERFRDRVDADDWRNLGWKPDEVAAVHDAVFRQAREDHPDDPPARLTYEGATLERWRTSGIPGRRATFYALLDIRLDEAYSHEAAGRESGEDIDAALATLVALREQP